MMKQFRYILSALALSSTLIFLVSCKDDRFQVPGKPSGTIIINRFDQDFQTVGNNVDSSFLNLYATKIMEVDEPGSGMYTDFYRIFHADPQIRKIYVDCQKKFSDIEDIEKNLTLALYRLSYFFPEIQVPKVYMHISCFGESIISSTGILSASIDNYLGEDYPAYQSIFQPYQAKRMHRGKMVSDYMTGWIRSEFTEKQLLNQERLLDYIVYEGKILFLLKIVMPDESMENLTGFDEEQLKWCNENEKNMWNGVFQLKHLYSTDRLVIAKYIEDAPKTSFFPGTPSGRALIWNGYKIVKSYMKRNKYITPKELMSNTNAQAILAGSAYHP